MTSSVTGLILTGGKSRRFGLDKALHVIDGATMIERIYLTLSEVVSPILISTSDASRTYHLPARHVFDQYPDTGPLGGLHAGLKAADTPWVFVTAVDLPFIEAPFIRFILENISEQTDAIIARGGDRLQPLFGCYRTSLVPRIEQRLESNLLSATRFAVDIQARVVELPEIGLLNVNRPSDLEGR